MKTEDVYDDSVLVHLNRDELALLNNALNEVCHGVKIPAFSTRLGSTREEAKNLLQQIGVLIDKLDDLSPDREREYVYDRRTGKVYPARLR